MLQRECQRLSSMTNAKRSSLIKDHKGMVGIDATSKDAHFPFLVRPRNMGNYIGQEVGQGVQAKRITPMSAMQAACIELGAECQICLTRTWGAPKGLACRQRPRAARYVTVGRSRARSGIGGFRAMGLRFEGYNPLYEYENGLKLHGGVKDVRTSSYNQT
ncbi:hypothetical protein MTR67_030528 [Solanum verrucosum]|uniref:Uncharacterized protein n=1 Tax=Solanum verrucosum TaxID=315347 RepID=A0AAF0RAM8_SOLVR|nr:hypothetical protein MTR67_030528 [Solanum verrucosum]